MNKAPTGGAWSARRGRDQMCDPVNTTVVQVGQADSKGAYWWVFTDAADHGDPEATATLIAAAPAMLRELMNLLPGLELDLRYAEPDDDRDALLSRVRGVREAIAKATQPASRSEKQS